MLMACRIRIKEPGACQWFHVNAHITCCEGEYPLEEEICRDKLIEIIKHYAHAYFCEVAAFSIMGNHYHLVVRMDEERPLTDEEKWERAFRLFPGAGRDDILAWPPKRWQRLDKRLFDISEFMRNIQAMFGRWYNDRIRRRGGVWAGRFRSTLLATKAAVVECMLYVDLNGVRAGLVTRPEDHEGSSLHLRARGQDRWLMPLIKLIGTGNRTKQLAAYRRRLYRRGAVPTKENHAQINAKLLAEEERRDFVPRGAYRQRLRYWTDGLIIGSEEQIRKKLAALRKAGVYKRRAHPIAQQKKLHLSLREQRGHGQGFA
jgi:REP element-mobilizing transposase RayT